MRTRWLMAATVLASAWAVPMGVAVAGKPSGGGGGGGGGGGAVDSGSVYFQDGGLVGSMNPDGSGKASLPAGVSGEPSRLLHGGQRWFLQTRQIAGETYPPGEDGIAGARRELFAIRGDGALAVQLTMQADLEPDEGPRWTPGDTSVSWQARRWANGAVTEGGIYVGTLLFDDGGSVTGLAAQPASPSIALSLVLWTESPSNYRFGGDVGPDVYTHDWSPDGAEVVHDRFTGDDVWIADLSGNRRALISSFARSPAWSPDGAEIAYNSRSGDGKAAIATIASSGGSATTVVKPGPSYSVGRPFWSPAGTHLVFGRLESNLEQYVHRVAASGGKTTNLTSGLTHAMPTGWR